jgi:hypothetical protein
MRFGIEAALDVGHLRQVTVQRSARGRTEIWRGARARERLRDDAGCRQQPPGSFIHDHHDRLDPVDPSG